MKISTQTKTLVIFIVGVLFICGGGYFGIKQYRVFQQQRIEQEKRNKEQQELLSEQQNILEQMKGDIKDMTEAQKTDQTELKENIEDVEKDLTEIIKEWEPYLAYIDCTFTYDEGTVYDRVSGSGTLIPSGLTYLNRIKTDVGFIFTNRHVVVSEKTGKEYGPGYCTIYLNGLAYYYNRNDESYVDLRVKKKEYGNSTIDWAVFVLSNPPGNTLKLPNSEDIKICTGKPSIGDKLIILGYPGIGSIEGITATEGIISGTEGSYYITSAKIEHGNSGGAAILVKNNCYLGIPTYVLSGTVESLGRILDINEAINDWNNLYE